MNTKQKHGNYIDILHEYIVHDAIYLAISIWLVCDEDLVFSFFCFNFFNWNVHSSKKSGIFECLIKSLFICERLVAFRILQNDNEEFEDNMEF